MPDDQTRDYSSSLVRRFPSVTVIDVDALLSKVREIMERADQGMRYVFLFTLLAGFTVLLAAIQSTLDERRHESAILRTLGADRKRRASRFAGGVPDPGGTRRWTRRLRGDAPERLAGGTRCFTSPTTAIRGCG